MRDLLDNLALWRNPVFVKGVRTRLRLRHALAWGTVSFVLAAFLFLLIYLSFNQRMQLGSDVAAKATLPFLLILQGVILMMFGTGSVASGIALERDSGILDFHRMTPLSPARKILGYLFGLPVREYFMFAATLPFVGLAVGMGGLPLFRVLHLYGVFFCAVVLYHLTGFASGMIAAKPRRANWVAMVAIVALYLFLPQLSRLGFTFFGYFTILPAFRAIVAEELPMSSWELQQMAAAYGLTEGRTVQFFTWSVHPTVYTLLLMGFLSATLFVVVHRKWRQETNHAFPKLVALLFFAALQVLVLGSLWPYVTTERMLPGPGALMVGPGKLRLILRVYFIVTVLAAGFLLHLVTPTQATMRKGLRRARRETGGRVLSTSDAASSFWIAVALVAMAAACYAALMRVAWVSGFYFDAAPSRWALLAPVVLIAGIVLTLQAAREAWSPRAFVFFTFLLWGGGLFVFIVGLAGWGMSPTVAYLSSPTPFISLLFAADGVTTYAGNAGLGAEAAVDSATVTGLAVVVYLGLALLFTALRLRGARALRAADDAPLPVPAAPSPQA